MTVLNSDTNNNQILSVYCSIDESQVVYTGLARLEIVG